MSNENPRCSSWYHSTASDRKLPCDPVWLPLSRNYECGNHAGGKFTQATSPSEAVCINPDHFEGIFICAVDRLEFGVEGAETPVGEGEPEGTTLSLAHIDKAAEAMGVTREQLDNLINHGTGDPAADFRKLVAERDAHAGMANDCKHMEITLLGYKNETPIYQCENCPLIGNPDVNIWGGSELHPSNGGQSMKQPTAGIGSGVRRWREERTRTMLTHETGCSELDPKYGKIDGCNCGAQDDADHDRTHGTPEATCLC